MKTLLLILHACLLAGVVHAAERPDQTLSPGQIEAGFRSPPPECRPEVFWDWMGGQISKEGITKDLEALAGAGVGGVMIMQMPDQLAGVVQWRYDDYPGKVRCLSDEWFGMMNHAAVETDRLGLGLSFFICPGWSHCGGPWIQPEQGLKVLVQTRTPVTGPQKLDRVLPRAPIRQVTGANGGSRPLPGSRDAEFWEKIRNPREDFYRDVAVLAVPKPGADGVVPSGRVLDLTRQMDASGRLTWEAPAGEWTIHRLGMASENGPNHPAPPEAMGLECDRMDAAAVRKVFDGMTARILREARAKGCQSVKRFETDSYEGGHQDFCLDFQEQFRQRRGYDATPWLPAWVDRGLILGSADLVGRFRADMLRTISELWIERFYGELRRLADENQVQWIFEPYFSMSHDWRTAASRAHISGSEFWMGGPQLIGPAPDTAALYGQRIVWAEAFTSECDESAWRNDPWRMKPYGDAAYCQGINHFIVHGFTHNPWNDRFQPGVTMGFWGTQLTRHTTWWPWSQAWHRYLARCQFLLQQGWPVADVLAYPPRTEHLPSPVLDAGPYRQTVLNDETLLGRLSVRDGRIVLPHGASYAALALVPGQPLRPEALRIIRDLVNDGATLIAPPPPPVSPSLENHPACDQEVAGLIKEVWGQPVAAGRKGRVHAKRPLTEALHEIAGGPDFTHRRLHPPFFSRPDEFPVQRVLFTHRRGDGFELYFVSNQDDCVNAIEADFRVSGLQPELWDPVSGDMRPLTDFHRMGARTVVPLRLEPRQSVFIVFRRPAAAAAAAKPNSIPTRQVLSLVGAWDVSFDPKRGGPAKVTFESLADWSQRAEPGIRYYSGAAVYRKTFDLPAGCPADASLHLDLGKVRNLASVRLNGQELGVVWCAPWRVALGGAVRPAGNQLEITAVNTWVNRLIGDEQEVDDMETVFWDPPERKGGYAPGIPGRGLKELPSWLIEAGERPSTNRLTFATWRFYAQDAPLETSGLLGPVRVVRE